MKISRLLFLVILYLPLACGRKEKQKPNVIYILADDLGYGDVGFNGQTKIRTPNIDRLAKSGMVFTQHYSGAPVCAPSRYVLLTGMHTGHAFIRGNDEWTERGDVWNYAKTVEDPNLEGQRPIPLNTFTIGQLMKNAGYKTGMIGKWGLGAPMTESVPNHFGFDFYFGYNCQRQAHNLYPRHLWKNKEKVWLQNEVVPPGTKLSPGADLYAKDSYARYFQNEYAPQLMQDEVLDFIRTNKANPFFLYYATPIPHLPLQVPEVYLDRYVKIFGDEDPYDGSRGYFPNRYPHAAYAGMVSLLDDQVGEIVALLKDLGIYENTLIMFTSDNGPTYTGGFDADFFNSGGIFPNQYGRTKGFVYEGGIHIPMIASWPAAIREGTQTNRISAFYDILPTLADLTGQPIPEGLDGISFYPTLKGTMHQTQHEYLYWEIPEYGGQQSVRMGKWKAIRKDIHKGNLALELYDLSNDPAEQENVASRHEDIVRRMEKIMLKEHVPAETGLFRFKTLGEE